MTVRRIARLIACWALIVVGVLGTLLFGLVVIYGETSGVRGGAIVLIAISLALVAGGVFGLRRRLKPPEEPVPSAEPAPEPLSRAAARARDRLRRGETIVLLPRRRRWALILAGSAAFFAGSVWWFVETPFLLSAVGVLLFGAGTALSLAQLVPGWAYLRIAPDGLVIRQPVNTKRLAWNDVDLFTPYEIHHQYGSNKMVGFDRRDLVPERQGLWQTVTRGMTGVDGTLPDTYGMGHEELAELLNEARERYATEHGPSPSMLADIELARRAAAVPRDRLPLVTVALTCVCIAAFAIVAGRYGAFPSAAELDEAGGASRDALADGDWWTLLSANVLHAHPFHLLLNLAGFAIVGWLLEREVGWLRFGALCLIAGVTSMGLGVLLQQGAGVVGLSGVVFAAASWAVLRDTHRTRGLGIVAWSMLPVGVIYTFLVPGISIGAHLGGMLAGFALGHLFERGLTRRHEPAFGG